MSAEIAILVGYFLRPIFLLQHLTISFTSKIGLSYMLLFRVYHCVATITVLKIATDTVANMTNNSGLVATKKMATTFLCANNR